MWGGLAQTGIELVIARGIQGVFAALLAPAALALLTVTFPSGRERGTAFAVFGTVAGTGAAVGLVLVLVLSVLTTLFIGTQPLGPVSGYAAVYPVSAGCLFLAAIIAFTMLRDRRAPQPAVAAAAS